MSWPPRATRRRTRSRWRSTESRPTNQTLTAMPYAAARCSSSAIVRPAECGLEREVELVGDGPLQQPSAFVPRRGVDLSCVGRGNAGGWLRRSAVPPHRDRTSRRRLAQRRAGDAALARAVAAGENENRRLRGRSVASSVRRARRPSGRSPGAACRLRGALVGHGRVDGGAAQFLGHHLERPLHRSPTPGACIRASSASNSAESVSRRPASAAASR